MLSAGNILVRKTVEILALIRFYSHRRDRHQLIITKLKVKMFCTKRIANRENFSSWGGQGGCPEEVMSEVRFEFISVNRGERSIPDSMGSMCKGPEMSRA